MRSVGFAVSLRHLPLGLCAAVAHHLHRHETDGIVGPLETLLHVLNDHRHAGRGCGDGRTHHQKSCSQDQKRLFHWISFFRFGLILPNLKQTEKNVQSGGAGSNAQDLRIRMAYWGSMLVRGDASESQLRGSLGGISCSLRSEWSIGL